MDITDKIGTIRVPVSMKEDKFINKISTRKNIKKIDYWKADVTLVWFSDIDQTVNDNKSYTATLRANRVECN